MKGLLLAGGKGTRLRPLTRVTNKHLLPVGRFPMIYYPLHTLIEMGLREIMIVVGGESIADVMALLGSGSRFGVNLSYRVQDEAGGIAQAVGLAEGFAREEHIVVILGDNIFHEPMSGYLERFRQSGAEAAIFYKKVDHPERFGVLELDGAGRPLRIEEKPAQPKSPYAVTGLYIYPPSVFDIVRGLKPSARGELEITDVNNAYIERGQMCAFELSGFWSDAGTFQTLRRASNFALDNEFHWYHTISEPVGQ